MKKHWAEVTRYKDNTKRKRKDTHYIHVGRTCSSERGKATNSGSQGPACAWSARKSSVAGVWLCLRPGCVLDLDECTGDWQAQRFWSLAIGDVNLPATLLGDDSALDLPTRAFGIARLPAPSLRSGHSLLQLGAINQHMRNLCEKTQVCECAVCGRVGN